MFQDSFSLALEFQLIGESEILNFSFSLAQLLKFIVEHFGVKISNPQFLATFSPKLSCVLTRIELGRLVSYLEFG